MLCQGQGFVCAEHGRAPEQELVYCLRSDPVRSAQLGVHVQEKLILRGRVVQLAPHAKATGCRGPRYSKAAPGTLSAEGGSKGLNLCCGRCDKRRASTWEALD